ncbi:MAG: IclR family transcriptional regulator C-terminal domain-containing protein [Spirochaetia bacterium]|jgi:IclR family KDG regulon transcriptional repressor
MKGPAPIKAVIKTMKILECLSSERSLGITELTGRVSAQLELIPMDKSTVYRFLVSLMDLGFVYQDPQTERYGLTLKLFEIGMSVLERLELWREAEPVVKEIARVTGETVHLATLDEDDLVYLGKVESMRTLRVSMMSRVGRSAPAYCTGVGKILLAYLPRKQLDHILKKEKPIRYTDKTIVRRADLDRELSSIREKGYAIDNEEHEAGVRCVAAPVRNNDSVVCGAVSVSVPTVRLPDKEIPRYRDIIVQAAEEISRRMGYRTPQSTEDTPSKRRRREEQRRGH